MWRHRSAGPLSHRLSSFVPDKHVRVDCQESKSRLCLLHTHTYYVYVHTYIKSYTFKQIPTCIYKWYTTCRISLYVSLYQRNYSSPSSLLQSHSPVPRTLLEYDILRDVPDLKLSLLYSLHFFPPFLFFPFFFFFFSFLFFLFLSYFLCTEIWLRIQWVFISNNKEKKREKTGIILHRKLVFIVNDSTD